MAYQTRAWRSMYCRWIHGGWGREGRGGLERKLLQRVSRTWKYAACLHYLFTAPFCRATCLWLHVAEYNTNGVAFYTSYGFTAVPGSYKQGERGRHQLMRLQLEGGGGASAAVAVEGAGAGGEREELQGAEGVGAVSGGGGGGRGFGVGGGGKGGAGKKRGKGAKRRALAEGGEAGEGPGWSGRGPAGAVGCCVGREGSGLTGATMAQAPVGGGVGVRAAAVGSAGVQVRAPVRMGVAVRGCRTVVPERWRSGGSMGAARVR